MTVTKSQSFLLTAILYLVAMRLSVAWIRDVFETRATIQQIQSETTSCVMPTVTR